MLSPRQRPIVFAIATLLLIWAIAFAGYTIAKNAKVTPEKVRAYAESVDFSKLTGDERRRAMDKLAKMLNSLSLEERQRLRLDRSAYRWFEQMTEEEKARFIEATMPTGFKQMLGAFQEMPEDRRKRFVEEAMKRMKEERAKAAANGGLPTQPDGTNAVALSPELQQQITKIGLQTFYSESSAQTKAEMAPLLEEMQRMMEGGVFVIGGRRR